MTGHGKGQLGKVLGTFSLEAEGIALCVSQNVPSPGVVTLWLFHSSEGESPAVHRDKDVQQVCALWARLESARAAACPSHAGASRNLLLSFGLDLRGGVMFLWRIVLQSPCSAVWAGAAHQPLRPGDVLWVSSKQTTSGLLQVLSKYLWGEGMNGLCLTQDRTLWLAKQATLGGGSHDLE